MCDWEKAGHVECFSCETWFDGTAYRWRCPTCGFKVNCCEGAPQ